MPTPLTSADNSQVEVGRNEPCPCNSGQKYKKCCFRAHQVQREAQKQNTSVESLINAQTIPWKVFTLLQQVNENNLLSLFYDMSHEEGPFRKRFAEKPAFLQAADAGHETLVAGPGYDLRQIRLDEPEVYMLLTHGIDDPKVEIVRYEVVVLRPNEVDSEGNSRTVDHKGFRIWDIQRHTRRKDELSNLDLSLSDLGVEWRPVTKSDAA